SSLSPGVTYQVVVRAKYNTTNSQTSNVVTVVTSRVVTCGGSIASNASATTSSTYTQTWNGSSWTPNTSWSHGAGTCGYSCNGGTSWNGSACQASSYSSCLAAKNAGNNADGVYTLSAG
ncbi:MAG TPA: hypothetical protein PK765_05140, partial [bacterium]|nr:hypothetical protein [bacterium]